MSITMKIWTKINVSSEFLQRHSILLMIKFDIKTNWILTIISLKAYN